MDVAAGETAAAPIPLELTAVTTSVTVTAADSARIGSLRAIRAIHDDHAIHGGSRPECERKSREPAAPRPRSGPRPRRANQYEGRALHAGRMAGEFRERHRSGDRRRSDEPAYRRGVVGAGDLESLRPGVRKIHGRRFQRRNQTREHGQVSSLDPKPVSASFGNATATSSASNPSLRALPLPVRWSGTGSRSPSRSNTASCEHR